MVFGLGLELSLFVGRAVGFPRCTTSCWLRNTILTLLTLPFSRRVVERIHDLVQFLQHSNSTRLDTYGTLSRAAFAGLGLDP